jgi:hypothetical protein
VDIERVLGLLGIIAFMVAKPLLSHMLRRAEAERRAIRRELREEPIELDDGTVISQPTQPR